MNNSLIKRDTSFFFNLLGIAPGSLFTRGIYVHGTPTYYLGTCTGMGAWYKCDSRKSHPTPRIFLHIDENPDYKPWPNGSVYGSVQYHHNFVDTLEKD